MLDIKFFKKILYLYIHTISNIYQINEHLHNKCSLNNTTKAFIVNEN